ncbi:PREDICTED: receptor like protein 30-like [Ipomoea nil]|uniref:receptor like protein 30-like n=1 Tax=Ipomoea nil TaxID=35883 RepID=UPI0009014558|nr:PREDICTED: receptor like protein 30-like [Ipomoea nil]XP_019186911.1 PREDICTED: receptor like protein 30-like [Ipomoea nil]
MLIYLTILIHFKLKLPQNTDFSSCATMKTPLLPWLFLISLLRIICCLNISLVAAQCMSDQKMLLLQLRSSLKFDSTFSTKLVNWNKNTTHDCCYWPGVECDDSGHVIGLILDNEAITVDGFENSSSLFRLQYLERLNLAFNSFNSTTPFPVQIYNLTKLTYLNLSNAGYGGQIPNGISRLTRLVTLDLSVLYPIGPPLRLENPNLKQLLENSIQLRQLYLDGVDLSSTVPKFLPQINILKMSSCGLQKFLDLRNQSSLIHLDLSDNEIRGEIPNWIWNVGNGSLYHLNLSHNFLDGLEKTYTIPRSILVLDLHSNQLQGQLPIGVATALDATYLDYSNNFFNGSIPFDLGSYAPFASFLSLSNNSFTGEIPESICNTSYLQVLDLSNNKLNGILPSCLFSNFEYLAVLNLGKNQITGNILDLFPSNCALQTLDLGRNVLEGRIPSSLINCASLEVLNLGGNKIVDTFPCPLKNLSSLRVLVLRSNGFHGNLHCVNANNMWPNLQIIDIASNNFSGELSPKLLNWKGMTVDEDNATQSGGNIRFDYLRLNNFYYQDTVMLTVKGAEMELVKILKVFTSIDFSSNNFHGIIPNTIGALTSLYFLNLSHNALIGNIPKTIGNLKTIESLDLSANQLNGKIPAELAKLTFLSVLNLSFNRLSGVIPTGNQLNTFGPDSYLGNQELCGFPLSKSCKSPTSLGGGESAIQLGGAQLEIKWEYVTSALGFSVGLSMYLWMLLHNKRCKKISETKKQSSQEQNIIQSI